MQDHVRFISFTEHLSPGRSGYGSLVDKSDLPLLEDDRLPREPLSQHEYDCMRIFQQFKSRKQPVQILELNFLKKQFSKNPLTKISAEDIERFIATEESVKISPFSPAELKSLKHGLDNITLDSLDSFPPLRKKQIAAIQIDILGDRDIATDDAMSEFFEILYKIQSKRLIDNVEKNKIDRIKQGMTTEQAQEIIDTIKKHPSQNEESIISDADDREIAVLVTSPHGIRHVPKKIIDDEVPALSEQEASVEESESESESESGSDCHTFLDRDLGFTEQKQACYDTLDAEFSETDDSTVAFESSADSDGSSEKLLPPERENSTRPLRYKERNQLPDSNSESSDYTDETRYDEQEPKPAPPEYISVRREKHIPLEESDGKENISLRWTSTHNNKILFFSENEADSDEHDSGFIAMNITRAQFADTLLEALNRDMFDACDALHQEIEKALATNVIHSTQFYDLYTEKTSISEQYNIKIQELRVLAPDWNPEPDHDQKEQIKSFMWLAMQTHDLEQTKAQIIYFLSINAARDHVLEKIIDRCKKPEIVKQYIKLFRKKLCLGYDSALFYAELNNIDLFIWTPNLRYEDGLDIVCCTKLEAPSDEIHMLHLPDSNYFYSLTLRETRNLPGFHVTSEPEDHFVSLDGPLDDEAEILSRSPEEERSTPKETLPEEEAEIAERVRCLSIRPGSPEPENFNGKPAFSFRFFTPTPPPAQSRPESVNDDVATVFFRPTPIRAASPNS